MEAVLGAATFLVRLVSLSRAPRGDLWRVPSFPLSGAGTATDGTLAFPDDDEDEEEEEEEEEEEDEEDEAGWAGAAALDGEGEAAGDLDELEEDLDELFFETFGLAVPFDDFLPNIFFF